MTLLFLSFNPLILYLMPQVFTLSDDWKINKSVFSGILLREATARFFAHRFAWFWMVFEPLFHIGYLMLLFGLVRVRQIDGMSIFLWIAIGIFAFLSFRNTWTRTMNAIDASRALLVYRQIRPVKLVLMRAVNELSVSGLVLISLALVLYIFNEELTPDLPLEFIYGFFALWFLGLGLGLVISFLKEFVPEISNVVKLIMMPLYLLSGVIFPLSTIPMPYLEWLLYNPIAHGLEWMRASFSLQYYPVSGLDINYLVMWALTATFLGFFVQHYGYKYFEVTK